MGRGGVEDRAMSWLALAFAALIGCCFGMFLLWKGRWSGTDYPICRQCAYDLRGEKPSARRNAHLGSADPALDCPRLETHRCPECGQTLTKETIETAIARFQRHPGNRVAVAIVVVSSFVLGWCATIALLGLLRL